HREREPMTTMTAVATRRASRRQLLIAGGLGLLAAVLVVVFLSGSRGSSSTSVLTTAVVVAAQPIDAGEQITPAKLTLKDVPTSTLASDALKNKTEADGKVARYPINKGEAVVSSRLVQPAAAKTLSFQIPAGRRAMTVPVSETTTPAALIAPGDFVDV